MLCFIKYFVSCHFVVSLECPNVSDQAVCFLLEINATYLIIVTQKIDNREVTLDYNEIMEKYTSNIDGFSDITAGFDRLEEEAEQTAFDSAFSIIWNFVEKDYTNYLHEITSIKPFIDPPPGGSEVIVQEQHSPP